MKPGYYVVTRDTLLSAGAQKASHRIKLHKGDWLVTDGVNLGRFNKLDELDWLPLEWVRGTLVVIDDQIAYELGRVAVPIALSKLEAGFHALVFVEPGEPVPDMPRPPLGQLRAYLLRNRRVAFTYDRRP